MRFGIAEKSQAGPSATPMRWLYIQSSDSMRWDDGQFRARTKERQLCQLHSYRYINYSNICVLSCQFCAFAARKRDPQRFEYAIERSFASLKKLFLSGSLSAYGWRAASDAEKDWYLDLLRELRALDPDLHIKAFTVSKASLARRIFRLRFEKCWSFCASNGLGSITGVARKFSIRVSRYHLSGK